MKQKYLKWLFALILVAILSIANTVLADTSTADYTIQNYDINMVVNENNTFDITETITTNFNVAKHGIIRKIPLKNTITRTDGTTSNNRAKVTNVKVNADYSTSKENGYEVIKIGDADSTLVGEHTYKISYTYDIGKDPLKDNDELYYNLIGNEWDTSINDTTFTITMPKSFDKSSLGFSSGAKGTINSSNISYNVSGNTIKGTCSTTLNPGEGLTVRLTLPEGYFIRTGNGIDIYSIFVIIICIAFTFIAYLLWSKYGKDDPVVETVEFYPPEGYNSAEIGFLYNGEADTKGIISLLIYLANKGYLKIEEIKGNGIFAEHNGFKITKLKEYNEKNEYEKIFFNGLFKNHKTVDIQQISNIMKEAKAKGEKMTWHDAREISENDSDSKMSVTEADLRDHFYTTLDRIKTKLNSKENKNKIFEAYASSKIKWLIGMIIAIFILITVKPLIEYGDMGLLIVALLFPGIGFSIAFAMLTQKSTPIGGKVFGLIWGIGFGGIPWAFSVLPAITDNAMYFITYIIGIICVVVLFIFVGIMKKRTAFGNEILGKLRGFRRFLETAEKPQLEALVKENPEYFYNILPYTYALGVSSVWMKQFETIAIEPPEWYGYTGTFNMYTFSTFMDSTMTSAQSAMTSTPSSSTGGSFSTGGGFSGGGSGGGGGGSW